MTRPMADWPQSGFGERLKALREARGLSQQALAGAVPCSIFTVSKLERGAQEPSWPLVIGLAKALGVEIAAFLPVPSVESPADKPKAGPGRPRKAQGVASEMDAFEESQECLEETPGAASPPGQSQVEPEPSARKQITPVKGRKRKGG
jgi:transcriptional regulator with XRE-family HTH domain